MSSIASDSGGPYSLAWVILREAARRKKAWLCSAVRGSMSAERLSGPTSLSSERRTSCAARITQAAAATPAAALQATTYIPGILPGQSSGPNT
jgi:hypothetical protein